QTGGHRVADVRLTVGLPQVDPLHAHADQAVQRAEDVPADHVFGPHDDVDLDVHARVVGQDAGDVGRHALAHHLRIDRVVERTDGDAGLVVKAEFFLVVSHA